MSEMIVEPAEFRLTDFEVIPPELVKEIGTLLLGAVTEMKEQKEFALEEHFKVKLFDSRYDYAGAEFLSDVHMTYKELLKDTGVNFTRYATWLVHAKVEHLSWHIDKAGDVRFMLNVGEDSSVEVAEVWDPTLYRPGDAGYPAPFESKLISLPTGSMYAVNNLVTNQDLLRPHQIPLGQEDRVVLRTCFYAEEDWQGRAINGGVPVALSRAV